MGIAKEIGLNIVFEAAGKMARLKRKTQQKRGSTLTSNSKIEVLKNKNTGEWEVTVNGGTYSFLDESDARQFANLQEMFIEEYGNDSD